MNEPDPLSPEKLQFFIAGMSGMPPDEVRKAISEFKAAKLNAAALQGQFMGGCLGFGRRSMFTRALETNLRLHEDRIRNAMDVWKDDLKGERFDL